MRLKYPAQIGLVHPHRTRDVIQIPQFQMMSVDEVAAALESLRGTGTLGSVWSLRARCFPYKDAQQGGANLGLGIEATTSLRQQYLKDSAIGFKIRNLDCRLRNHQTRTQQAGRLTAKEINEVFPQWSPGVADNVMRGGWAIDKKNACVKGKVITIQAHRAASAFNVFKTVAGKG